MAALEPRDAVRRKSSENGAGKLALFGWVLFDWATQPFYTLVVTFLFAPYFVNGFMDDPARGASLWAYATGIAELIAAVSVLLFVGLCGLWFAIPGELQFVPLVLLSFGLATIGAELATVFTNAMMPSLIGRVASSSRTPGFGFDARDAAAPSARSSTSS